MNVFFLLPFAAGSFLHIAGSDLVPEIHHHERLGRRALHVPFFVAGLFGLHALRNPTGGHG